MPKMGRPVSNSKNPFKKVTMAPRKATLDLSKNQLSKEQIINKATGRKVTDPRFDRKINNKMGKDEFLKLLNT